MTTFSIEARANKDLAVAPQSLTRDAFVDRFGGVYEHSPWVAERTWDAGRVPDATTALALGLAMAETLAEASDEEKLGLIRAHPDLAGKAAVAGTLTQESTTEQASAGLDHCSPEEFARFQSLNAAYGAAFGFPFIMAVKFSNRTEILDAFDARLKHDVATEFETALQQINKIALIRLLDL